MVLIEFGQCNMLIKKHLNKPDVSAFLSESYCKFKQKTDLPEIKVNP